ncbi:glycyl-tRNA synthetase, partial [mine drainage metagenome]
GSFGEAKAFNMMIDVSLGPDKSDRGYLRPETAQSAYLNYYREFNLLRQKLPLGLAIIGRAYRNEISPRQGLYRLRELVQAELQIFFDEQMFKPDLSDFSGSRINVVLYTTGKLESLTPEELVSRGYPAFYVYHMCLIDRFYRKILGVLDTKLRFLEKGGDDKAFYNKIHMDIELEVESWGGFKEVGGLHFRDDYDLTSHSKGSNKSFLVKSEGREFMPNVLELSFGVDRNVWAQLDLFFNNSDGRQLLSLKPYIAPYTAAVLPLQNDEQINGK